MKTIIPLAGKDIRFEKIDIYKPLIDIKGKPLIYRVLQSNGFVLSNLLFIVLFEHEKKYGVVKKIKNFFGKEAQVEIIDRLTQGAPNTILKIKEAINDSEDILIDLGDVIRDIPDFKKDISENNFLSGIIPVDKDFTADKWGYVFSKNNNFTVLVEKSEKKVKGGATMGLYYFSKGRDFVKYAQEMIDKKQMVESTGLYYVGPVYNNYKENGENIGISNGKVKYVLGGPEQIENYIKII